MLKLKLQYFGHLMRHVDSLEKTLMLGGIGDRRRRGDRGWDGWMVSRTQWTWVWVNSGSWWWTGRPGVLWFMGLQRVGHDWATELNWTDWRVAVWETQSLVKPNKRSEEEEGSGASKGKSHMVVQEFWLTQTQERKDLSLRDRLSWVVLGWKGPISIFSFWNTGQMFWKPALRQLLVRRSDSSRAEMWKSHFLNGLLAPFCLSVLIQFCFWLHHAVPY